MKKNRKKKIKLKKSETKITERIRQELKELEIERVNEIKEIEEIEMKLGKIEIKIIKERIKKRIIKTKTKNIRNRNRYKKINTN